MRRIAIVGFNSEQTGCYECGGDYHNVVTKFCNFKEVSKEKALAKIKKLQEQFGIKGN